MQLEPKKSFFGATSVEYLAYVVSREGLRLQASKVRSIINMARPKNIKELRGFVGLVNFYRDLWKRRAHHLVPLTSLINKKKGAVQWNPEAIESFGKIKEICAEDALLFYPNFGKIFDIHTDASEYQMGGIISQEGQVIAYWSKKLTNAQQKYPTIEQELLAIVELLKEFRNMLFGQRMRVCTDHKNLTYDNTTFSCNRDLRQRLLLEEFGPKIIHIEGKKKRWGRYAKSESTTRSGAERKRQ